jgi:hypothetical protein
VVRPPSTTTPSARIAQGPTRRAVLKVEAGRPGTAFAQGAIGLSIEADELATSDLSANHRSLVALMRLLGPAVLRLGGNSVDYAWWTTNHEAPPAWARSVITPSDLTALRDLMIATGWRAILGVEFSRLEPARAASEARVAERILGSRLLGLEIGNEPDGYGNGYLRPRSYNATGYLENLAVYGAAIRSVVPNLPLYGPDLAFQAWLPAIAADKGDWFTEITQHFYPTSYSVPKGTCKGTSVPTARELLSPGVREGETAVLRSLLSDGEVAHRSTRISETNATGSCDMNGGPHTSSVFASALWSLDWSLRAASAGVAGLNFHGYFGRCEPYVGSPICAPGDAAEAGGLVIGRPEFYGLLAARQLEGGRFIPVQIEGQNALENITAYASIQPHGQITLAIDNLAPGATSIRVEAPGFGQATRTRLTAPSLGATSGIRFGGASVSASAELRPRREKLHRTRAEFHVALAPNSAVIISLRR